MTELQTYFCSFLGTYYLYYFVVACVGLFNIQNSIFVILINLAFDWGPLSRKEVITFQSVGCAKNIKLIL